MPKTIIQNRVSKYNKHIRKYKKRVNPKIAKDITNIIKPYWELINKSSDYYKLRTLAIDADRINIRVKEDVQRLLEVFKHAVWAKIDEKIERLHSADRKLEYSTKNLRAFLEKYKIDSIYYSTLFNAIYGKMMINLGLEDFKLITNNAKKAKFYSAEIGNFGSDDIDKLMKAKLKGMKNAVLIITGNKSTTLDDLSFIWDSVIKCLPRNGKTCFSYKIEEGSGLEVDVMAVK